MRGRLVEPEFLDIDRDAALDLLTQCRELLEHFLDLAE